jgi:hypothetical protein
MLNRSPGLFVMLAPRTFQNKQGDPFHQVLSLVEAVIVRTVLYSRFMSLVPFIERDFEENTLYYVNNRNFAWSRRHGVICIGRANSKRTRASKDDQ